MSELAKQIVALAPWHESAPLKTRDVELAPMPRTSTLLWPSTTMPELR
jgi:hypothetical protein